MFLDVWPIWINSLKVSRNVNVTGTYCSTLSIYFHWTTQQIDPILTMDFYLEKSIIQRGSTAWTYTGIAYRKMWA